MKDICPVCGQKTKYYNGSLICLHYPIKCSYSETIKNVDFDPLKSKYVIFDLETTGLKKEDKIIEIAAISVENGEIVDEFQSLVKPKRNDSVVNINAIIQDLTGLDNDILSTAPEAIEALTEFDTWMKQASPEFISGHNIISFDIPRINTELKSLNLPTLKQIPFDTMQYAREHLKGVTKNFKQETLAEYYGIVYSAHRAMDDIKALFEIMKVMVKSDAEKANA